MAADLPLDQSVDFVGEWWAPADPRVVATGTLRYEPDAGLTLDAVSGGRLFADDALAQTPLLNGLTVDGRLITLSGLSLVDWSLSMPGGLASTVHVERAFVGMHARTEAELRPDWLAARVANLAEWLELPSFTLTGGFPRGGAIESTARGLVGLGRAGGGVLVTGWVETRSELDPPSAPVAVKLEQRGWVRFQGRHRLRYDTLFDSLAAFREFIALAANLDVPILELRGVAEVTRMEFGRDRRVRGREPVWVLFRQRPLLDVENTPAVDLLFRRADAAFSNHRPLVRWFRSTGLMEPVYNVYVAALPIRALYLEYRLLAFVQSLEAYDHRRTRKQKYLKDLVQEYVDLLPFKLRALVPAGFAQLVADTRNYLTHWNPRLEKRAAKDDRMLALVAAVKLLFELSMLHELGFTKTKILSLVESNQRLVRDFQRGFGSL